MTLLDAFLRRVGADGFPKCVDTGIENTWSAYTATLKPETGRLLSVLGFFYLLHQAKESRLIKGLSNPSVLYKQIRQDEFQTVAQDLTKQLAKLRVFDSLRVFKSQFALENPIRGTGRKFRFDLCLVPTRKEALDSCIKRLDGFLYRGSRPVQLNEVWRKAPLNSSAKPRSALPTYMQFLNNPSSVGFLPVVVGRKNTASIYAARAADDILIVRVALEVDGTPPDWMDARSHDAFLKALLYKCLLKIKG